MGSAYGELGQYADAIAAFKKAIEFKPDSALAYFGMGDACHQFKNYAETIAALQKYLALKPKGEMAVYAHKIIGEIENIEGVEGR